MGLTAYSLQLTAGSWGESPENVSPLFGMFEYFVDKSRYIFKSNQSFNEPFSKTIHVKWLVQRFVNNALSCQPVLYYITSHHRHSVRQMAHMPEFGQHIWALGRFEKRLSSISFHSQQILQANSRRHLAYIPTLPHTYICIYICIYIHVCLVENTYTSRRLA